MSTAALAVGLAVTGGVALLIAGITILFCVLHKNHPNGSRTSRSMKSQTSRSPRKQVVFVKSTSKATEKIKKKAEQLKAEKMNESCCSCFLCTCCRKKNGPPPHPPIGVEIKDPGEYEVTVIWNILSTQDSTTEIEGFRIYVRLNESPNVWDKVATVKSDIREYRIKGLNPSKRYVVGVSSKSRHGESSIIDTPTITLKRNPVQPGAPTEFDVREKTHNSITLSWKPPRKTGFSRIHNYHLTIKDFGENTGWNHLCTLPAFDRFMDFRATNLKSNNQYRFRVNAENIAGLGSYAETATIETLSEQPKPPDKPRGPIKYAKISHHSITLAWQPPEQDGGRAISGYAVEYKDKRENKWSKAGVCEVNINKFTVPKLQEDVEFVFRVIAMNDVGNSRPLIGPKVRTKLLEIPLSRRSSIRISSRGTSRESPSFGKRSMNMDELVLNRLQKHPSLASLENLDANLEADPHVPKSDFFTYGETEMEKISTKHNENRTRHSAASPLPLPITPKVKRTNRRRRQHHDFSPLPVHSSVPTTYGYGHNSAIKDCRENELDYHNNDDDSFHGIMSGHHSNRNSSKHGDGQGQIGNLDKRLGANKIQNEQDNDDLDEYSELKNKSKYKQHQTPSNVSFSYSHKY